MSKVKKKVAEKSKTPSQEFFEASKEKPFYAVLKGCGKVRLKPISTVDWLEFSTMSGAKVDDHTLNAFLLERSAHIKTKRVFADGEYEKIAKITEPVRLTVLGNKIIELSGMSVDYLGN